MNDRDMDQGDEVDRYLAMTKLEHRLVARRHVGTTEFWIRVLNRYPDLEDEVVLNKFLPDEILTRFSKDPDPRVRDMIAMKRRLPAAVRLTFAKDPCSSVRASTAHNPKTPMEIVKLLLDDPSEDVARIARKRFDETPKPRNDT